MIAASIEPGAVAAVSDGSRRPWLVALGLVLVVGIALFVVSRPSPSAGPALVSAASFSLPALGDDGGLVTLADLEGKPAVINFFASWCAPCRRELPALKASAARFGDDVNFVGINHQDTKADAIALLDEFGVTYPAGFDPKGGTAFAYGLRGLPATVFITADGRVRSVRHGELNAATLELEINALLEDITPDFAEDTLMRQADPRMSGSPRSTRSKRLLYTLVPLAALVLAGCGTDRPQSALDPQGPIARQLDNLFTPVMLIATVVFFFVEGLILYVIIRFRAKGADDAPKQVHGNARLELTWTVIPALILAVVGVFTVGTIFDLDRKAAGAEVVQIEVIGHQWWWEFKYPDLGITTANEMHIPAGARVQLTMTSVDVIHSFWPPKLAGKLDVVPGQNNHMQLEADAPGRYLGQCAEYCGLSHTNMKLVVVAHDAGSFKTWVDGQQRDVATSSNETVLEGQELFVQRGCGGCHTIEGLEGAAGKVGPDLTHLFSRAEFAGAIFDLNEKNLRKWLRDPPGMKPMMPDDGMGMPNLGLSEDDITKLIAYLETLK